MNALEQQIVAARAEIDAASAVENKFELGTRERRRAFNRTEAGWQNLFALRRQAREIFARERGWRLIPRTVDLRKLKAGKWLRLPDYETHYPWLDHADAFAIGPGRGRPVALVSHSYASFEDCCAFAELHGLRAELLPFSWYFQGFTIAVVYTRKDC